MKLKISLFQIFLFIVTLTNLVFSQSYHPVFKDSILIDPSTSNYNDLNDIAISSTGEYLYVVNTPDKKIECYNVDKNTGDITKKSDVSVLDSIVDLAISPDGKWMYAINDNRYSDSAILVLSINSETGALVNDDNIIVTGIADDLSEVIISPDGKNLYTITDDYGGRILWYDIDEVSGSITFRDTLSDDTSGLAGLNDIAISPDGKNVYTIAYSGDAITVFNRDETTGDLTLSNIIKNSVDVENLDGPDAITISPDGKSVYVVCDNDEGLLHFSRNTSSGELTFVEAFEDGVNDVDGFVRPEAVSVSNDGRKVIVGDGYRYLTWFERDVTSGNLKFIGYDDISETNLGPTVITFSSDDKYIYTNIAGNIAWFNLDTTSVIDITYPSGEDTIYNGTDCYIKWDKKECAASYVYITLLDKDGNFVDSINTSSTNNDGLYKWFISWDMQHGEYMICIKSSNSWEYSVSNVFTIDSVSTPDKIVDNNDYYKGQVIANQSAVTTDVNKNQMTLNHGNIYTVFKRGTGSAAADKEVKISVIDKDGNVSEKDITISNNETVDDPIIASNQNSVVAIYRYYNGTDYKLCVARSEDQGQSFSVNSLDISITPSELISDGVSRYYIRTSSYLYYSLDDGKNFTFHEQFDDLNFSTYSDLHVTNEYIWVVTGTTSDSIFVYRANKSDLKFEQIASWYTDMPSYDDYSSAAEDNKCVVFYQHEEVGTYYLRLREIDGNSLGEEIGIRESDASIAYMHDLYLDNDTIYFVYPYGSVDRFVNGVFDELNLFIDSDIGLSTYSTVGDIVYRGNGKFYAYTELTESGTRNSLTVWYWDYNQESPIIENVNSKLANFVVNSVLTKGSSSLKLSIGIPDLKNRNLQLKIYNLSGKLIKDLNYEINKIGWLRNDVDLSHVANGMYLMNVTLGARKLNERLLLRK